MGGRYERFVVIVRELEAEAVHIDLFPNAAQRLSMPFPFPLFSKFRQMHITCPQSYPVPQIRFQKNSIPSFLISPLTSDPAILRVESCVLYQVRLSWDF